MYSNIQMNFSLFVDEIDSFSVFNFHVLSFLVHFSNVGVKNSQFWIVHLGKFVLINFWSLNHFDLSDFNVLHWIDVWDFFGYFFLDNFWCKKLQHISGVRFGNFFGDDFVHFSSDWLLLGWLGIVGFTFLVWWLSGESYGENSQDVSILRFTILNCLNKSFSLFNEWAKLISGHVDSIKGSDSLSSFSLVDDQFDFSPMESILIGGEIRLICWYDSTFDAVLNFLETLSSVGTCESEWFGLERGGSF